MDSNEDTFELTSWLKTAVVRVTGATVTFTVVVVLALGALDVLSEHSLSRAAGIAGVETTLREWLPSRGVAVERQQLALASPAETVTHPAPVTAARVEPVVMPLVLPEPEASPPPSPAPAPTTPVAAEPFVPPPAVQLASVDMAAVARVLDESANSLDENDQPFNVKQNAKQGEAAPDDAKKTAAVPLPMPAPKRPPPPPTPAERLKLDVKGRAKAEKCLAEAIYFEARSESQRGQLAVAQVVMNRVFSPFYPNDVCGVVYQNAHRRLSCQFTFACDGIPERITEWNHWRKAKHIAKQTLDGKVWVREVAKSTHYHAAYVRPNWVREMKKMVRYGLHTFYRPHRWGDGSKETSWSNISHIAARVAIVE